ncbi:MAG: restriction endonuclease [Candidatus Dormibacterales bacterium]
METPRESRRAAREPSPNATLALNRTWSILWDPNKTRAAAGTTPPAGHVEAGLDRRLAQFKPPVIPANDAWAAALHRRDRPAPGPALLALREASHPDPASERVSALIRQKRQGLRVGDEDAIGKSVQSLSATAYLKMVGDMFRREGFTVGAGEGPDGDVIDLEAARAHKRWLINCQLRGVALIDLAPLVEMAKVVINNKAAGAFLVADGEFVPEALTYAHEHNLILIDRWLLLSMVVEMVLEDSRKPTLSERVRRRFRPARGRELRHILLVGDDHKN